MDNRLEKSDHVGGVQYRYSSDWIHTLETEEHWRLYWRQQKIMQKKVLTGHRVLEIGVGTGFTANYLRSKGIEVVTFDIDDDKKPDIVANLVSYEFKDEFDHILGFEVFEHIPFSEFEAVIRKLSKICRQYFFISVPYNEWSLLQLTIKLPIVRERYIQISAPKAKVTEPYHFWEVGCKDVSVNRFEGTFKNVGFSFYHKEKFSSRLFYAFKKDVS